VLAARMPLTRVAAAIYKGQRLSIEDIMHVAKWGNSLAVRLPKALVDELDLAPGDELEVVSASKKEIVVGKRDRRAEFLKAIAEFNWALPEGYKFDREEANKRR
jgi:antitoxin MazE